MPRKSILYVGLFVDQSYLRKNIRTSADRMAELFIKNHISTIITSSRSGRLRRLIGNIYTIFIRKKEFEIAIVPLFGTWPSFIWQEILTVLLKKLNKKIILNINGGSIPLRMDKSPDRFLKAMKRANTIVCPSGYILEYLKKYGVQTVLVENVVNLSEYVFHAKERIRPRIIWMRAFEHAYNPEMAIRVGNLLAQKYPDFSMVMAGKDSGKLNEIKNMVKQYKLDDKIIFPGYILLQEKLHYAFNFDIYICTNRIDNAPVSLIEFMALGLPIVSVNTGGIPYMIKDADNGLLVNLDDDEAMVSKIEMLIENPHLSNTISRNGYNYSRQYGEEHVMKKWLRVFEQCN